MSISLRAEGLALGYGGEPVVAGVDVAFEPGVVTAIVGANGCGKSTLLLGLGRHLKPSAGRVLLGGTDIRALRAKELGRRLSVLPQSPVAPEGILVADLVSRGRYAHQSWLRPWSSQDERAVADALEVTDCVGLAGRPLDELSGGQRQRVWLAMVIAQRTEVILLDEPITFLDLAHQVDVLELLTDLNRSHGRTIVMVLHDLNLAARYADRVVAMRSGRISATGRPREVIDAANMRAVFGLDTVVIDDPVADAPHVIPVGRVLPARPANTAPLTPMDRKAHP